MSLTWLKQPLEKTTVLCGKEWSYLLPIQSMENLTVDWSCDLVSKKIIQIDEDDNRQIRIVFPDTLDSCFGEISYVVTGQEEMLRGNILLRIKSGRSLPIPLASMEQTLPENGDEEDIKTPPAKSRKGPKENPDNKYQKRDDKPDVQKESKELYQVEKLNLKSMKLSPDSRYFIEVTDIEGNVFDDLRTELLKTNTIHIGKHSSEKGTPEIDLKGRFQTREAEKSCSRQQAEVWWSANERKILLRTTGHYPLKQLSDQGEKIDVPETYFWNLGQILIVPGGLRLKLLSNGGE